MAIKKQWVVGLAGGSASGKTSFIKRLTSAFKPSELVVISQDNYYKPLSQQKRDEYGEVNFDLPEAIDFGRLKKDLRKLLKGKDVELVEYTFNNPELFPSSIRLSPAPIILVEGLFIYSDPALKRMFDLRMYIHTELETAKQRRLKRDTQERGMSEEEVLHQWEHHVLPSYHDLLIGHKEDAHILIDNTHSFEDLLVEVQEQFNAILASS